MNNTIDTSLPVSTEIVEQASQFTEFLSSGAVISGYKPTTQIAKVLSDVLDIILKNKVLNMEDEQFRSKVELIQQNLRNQDSHSQRQFKIELEKNPFPD